MNQPDQGERCLSHYDPARHDNPQDWTALKEASPVCVQWDPDRSLTGEALAGRPAEHVYPLSPELARAIGADAGRLAREEGAR